MELSGAMQTYYLMPDTNFKTCKKTNNVHVLCPHLPGMYFFGFSR